MKQILLAFSIIGSLSLISGKKDNSEKRFNLKELEKSLSLIPGGSFDYGISNQDTPFDDIHVEQRAVTVSSFYIYIHEVSNGEYLVFINEVAKTDSVTYRQMLPDTTAWRNKAALNEPYVKHYFRHDAYRNYPVVGVTYEQADAYCKWLTNRYMKEEKRKYKNVEFKLPTIGQWTYAAKGGQKDAFFPWEGNSMQNNKGAFLANFRMVPQYGIGRRTLFVKNKQGSFDSSTFFVPGVYLPIQGQVENSAMDVTAPVASYYPNGYGIYNMSGNVSEYVKEKGITKGGGWKDSGYYLLLDVEQKYNSTNYTSSDRGFRFVMEIVQ